MQLNEKGLLFAHIPKTAGTSLRLAVQRHVKGWKVYADYDVDNPTTSRKIRKFYEDDDFSKISEINGPKTLLAGHFPITKYLPYYPIHRVISFVRDPVQRVISHFHDLQRRHGYAESLETFIKQRRFQNTQSRFFRGVPVEAVGFIGICEKYDESIDVINKVFNIEIPVTKYNTNKKKKDDQYSPPEEIVELVSQSNKADCELYDKALQLFNHRQAMLESGHGFVYGKIEAMEDNKISGWAVNPESSLGVNLNLLVDGVVRGNTIANQSINFLDDLNLINHPNVGFDLHIDGINPGDAKIEIRIDESNQELTR